MEQLQAAQPLKVSAGAGWVSRGRSPRGRRGPLAGRSAERRGSRTAGRTVRSTTSASSALRPQGVGSLRRTSASLWLPGRGLERCVNRCFKCRVRQRPAAYHAVDAVDCHGPAGGRTEREDPCRPSFSATSASCDSHSTVFSERRGPKSRLCRQRPEASRVRARNVRR